MEEEKYLYNEFINGDNKAFEKIVLKYKNNIIYFIIRYVRNIEIAEDIFQDVIVYILENKGKYNFENSLKTYFFMIAKSKSLDYLKHKKCIEKISEKELYNEERLLEDIISSKERKKKIRDAINKMPSDYQDVIYLTQIEKMSYKDAAKIIGKTERQIKTLVYNAKKKLKKILIKEKLVEVKENKVLKFLLIFIIITTISSGIIYAALVLYEQIIEQTIIIPVFSGKIGDTDMNRIWAVNFQISWNEFKNNVVRNDIKFKDDNSELVNLLNEEKSLNDFISNKDFYIKIGKTNPKLKEKIKEEIQKKYNLDNIKEFDSVNFDESEKGYTIFSMIYKKFNFKTPFDRLSDEKFNNSNEKVKYFGINNASDEQLYKNVEILFYNKEEYGIKLFTDTNDEIILYKTNCNDAFEKIYSNCIELSKKYTDKKEFEETDILRVPYISVNTLINYDELCGKIMEEDENIYISNALQNIIFNLNESGGNSISEVSIKEDSFLELNTGRNFNYNETFILFIKEKDKKYPYLALKVDNNTCLEQIDYN